jgi:hypothetical protein
MRYEKYEEIKKLLNEAIWQLNGFIETLDNSPMLTPDEESMLESAKAFVGKARKKLKKVI